MEFRILGPLEVRDGERLVAVSAAKQRALLAGLLLHANQAVPTGRLIELLWGGQPPPKAKVTLQNYVVRLRDVATARTGDPVLVTQPPGYLVRAGPDELDLLSFERLVAEGRQARAAGDVEHAASLLRSALALWRGPALADVVPGRAARPGTPTGLPDQTRIHTRALTLLAAAGPQAGPWPPPGECSAATTPAP